VAQQSIHLSTYHIFGTVQDKMKRISYKICFIISWTVPKIRCVKMYNFLGHPADSPKVNWYKKSVSEGGESNITGQCGKMKSSSVGCLSVLGARWIYAWSYQRVTIMASLRCCWDPSCQRALWTRLTRWQTSRRANLNTTAWWPFVSLGRYSRQPISCFLRWQSSHRRW